MKHEPAILPLTLEIERDGYRCREGQNYDEAVIFCITARVGSTALMAALASLAGASELPEIFNPRGTFPALSRRLGARSLQEYVNRYQGEAGTGRLLLFKTNYHDMMGMLRPQGVAQLFPRRRHVYLYRRDTIAQAYSLWKANKFNLWHARDAKAREAVGEIRLAEADMLRILRIVINLQREMGEWERFFRTEPNPVLALSFEEIMRDFEGAVRRAWHFAAGAHTPDGPVASPFVPTSNSADAANIEGVKRFLAGL